MRVLGKLSTLNSHLPSFCVSLPHGWDYSTVAPWLATIKILNAQIYITFSSAVLWRAHSSVTRNPQIFQCRLQSACPPASGINQLKKTTVSISALCFFQLTRAADHLTWSRVGPGSGLWSWSQKTEVAATLVSTWRVCSVLLYPTLSGVVMCHCCKPSICPTG